MKIFIDGYRNKKYIALVLVNGKYEIQIEGKKWGHAFRNYQNAKQTYFTLMTGYIGKDI